MDSSTLERTAHQTDRKNLLFLGGAEVQFHEFRQALVLDRPAWSMEWAPSVDSVRAQGALNPPDAIIVHGELGSAPEIRLALAARFTHSSIVFLRELFASGSPQGSSGPAPASVKRDPDERAQCVILELSVRDWKAQPAIQALLAKLKTLPTLPQLHLQITRELQSPEGSLERVSQYVRQDPVMAAKFLHVVNSASTGLAYIVTDPAEAVMFLGASRTRALVLMAGIFSRFDQATSCDDVSFDELWNHSLQVASLAQGVALMETEDPKLAETAYTAGLLHDLGKLMMAGNIPAMYATARRLKQHKRVQQTEAEMTILSTNHADVGACLLGSWRLPLRIVEAVAWHHKPSRGFDRAFSVLTAVHAANVMAHESKDADSDSRSCPRFDVFYLAKLGLANCRNKWREGCGLPVEDEQETFETQLRRRVENEQSSSESSSETELRQWQSSCGGPCA
jgi:putative nucleotidyltransferase with HDIG domain